MGLRILCCNPNGGAFYHITRGWENAFKALGHQFHFWSGVHKDWYDYEPHIYLGCSGWKQPIPQHRPNTIVGIHVNPIGPERLIPKPGDPDINEPQSLTQWTLKQNPDFVFGYGYKQDVEQYWGFWKTKHKIPVYGIPTAGDAVKYYKQLDPKFQCEIGYIGGRWPYKGKRINQWLLPVIRKFKSQVWGWGGWDNVSQYRGVIKDGEDRKLFSTANICPSIVEQHTSDYGIDVPERTFKVPLCGGFTICDSIKGFLGRYVSADAFPMANNPKEYLELCQYYLKHNEKRQQLAAKQRQEILKDHTYFSRINTFLGASGFNEESAATVKYIASLQ